MMVQMMAVTAELMAAIMAVHLRMASTEPNNHRF